MAFGGHLRLDHKHSSIHAKIHWRIHHCVQELLSKLHLATICLDKMCPPRHRIRICRPLSFVSSLRRNLICPVSVDINMVSLIARVHSQVILCSAKEFKIAFATYSCVCGALTEQTDKAYQKHNDFYLQLPCQSR